MSDDNVITIYQAANPAEAQMLADALGGEGIESTVEQTPSPFDGAGAIGDVEVFIREADAIKAQVVLDEFLAHKNGDT